MSIFRVIRQIRELRRLKKAARRDPTPGTVGALAERFIALGRTNDAYRVAEAGMRRFPTSERLQAVRKFATKQRLKAEIRDLRHEMDERPTPSVYSRLAEIYRELGNFDQALELCEQCVERFPLNENPYLITGEIRLTRFLQDKIAIDGVEAEKQLRRVVKLNSQNLKAHLLLAQIYFLIGAIEPMQEHLRSAIPLTPDSAEIKKFLRDWESGKLSSPPPRRALDEEDDEWLETEENLTVTELIRFVEVDGAFRNRPELCPAHRILPDSCGAPVARLDPENLKLNLRELWNLPGVVNATMLDRDGEALASCGDPDGLTESQFATLVTEILRTSEDTSRRMDMGTFYWCTVEGGFGGLTIAKVRNISVGMKYDSSVKPDRAHLSIEEFAARNFTSIPEVAGA